MLSCGWGATDFILHALHLILDGALGPEVVSSLHGFDATSWPSPPNSLNRTLTLVKALLPSPSPLCVFS